MGWSKGTGLGKKSQGMVQPIEVSKQRGRRGLGLQIKGLEAEEVEWDSSNEVYQLNLFSNPYIFLRHLFNRLSWLKRLFPGAHQMITSLVFLCQS